MEYLTGTRAIEKIVGLIFDNTLVPIFGSGFTAGSPSKHGDVPDGKCATQLMKKIIENDLSCSLDGIDDFFKVSNIFMNKISDEHKRKFFESYFTQVNLPSVEKNFLKIPWSHAFTINIDDAIENDKENKFEVVYPYQEARTLQKNLKLLYKLHGDANFELKYKQKNNIIFCQSQYMNSLEDENNKSIIGNLKTTYKEYNMLFIGCSLNNEIDLEQVYSSVKNDCSSQTLRMILRTTKPSFIEEIELEKYGINTVVLVSDYIVFYEDIYNQYRSNIGKKTANNFPYKNPRIKTFDIDNKQKSLKFFSTSNIFLEKENTFCKYSLLVTRTCIDKIEKLVNKNNFIVVQGRRFSGKTTMICNILDKFKKYSNIFYFPSSSTQNEEVIKNIISENIDSLLIFDSNSVDHFAYQLLSDTAINNTLNKSKNKLIMFVNSSDNRLLECVDAPCIKIPTLFDYEELEDLNKVADRYAIPKKKEKMTNMDYLAYLSSKNYLDDNILRLVKRNFTINEIAFLILLAVNDKVYSRQLTEMNISRSEVDILSEKMMGIIEKESTGVERRSTGSIYKYVHNSKYCLLLILKEIRYKSIIEGIKLIVKRLKNSDENRAYIEVVKFDTLNQIFSQEKGSAKLIYSIYDALETELSNDMDYWLQRAKSIYRIRPDLEALKRSYSYALKAHEDGDFNLRAKAAMSLSLISCLIAKYDSKNKISYQEKAVNYMYEAINSDFYRNKTYLRNAINVEQGRRLPESIINVCLNLSRCTDKEIKMKVNFIINKLNKNSLIKQRY